MGRQGISVLVLVVFLASATLHAAPESRLMRFPDVHGDKVIFTYAADLWIVSAEGGVARRLTTHPGGEMLGKFSPDGKTIAFTASYDGNTDIFTIPAEGGQPKRLTYHPYSDLVLEWHPSGEKILFRSARNSEGNPGPRYRKLFTIAANGGYPEQLPLFEGELTSYSPDGKRIAYNRMSREFRTWKRYKGGMAQDIWIYDLEKNEVDKLTDYEGTDAFPMWYEDKIYFISDREHTMNVYCFELGSRKIRKITNHRNYDVKWPSLGGDAIVYENGGYLYLLDLATEETKKIPIEIPSDLVLRRSHFEKVGQMISSGGISKTGKRAVFEARGDIFTVPAEKGEIRNLTHTPGIRERNPVWSPDGKWITYLSDKTGEYEIYLRSPDGKGEEVKITRGSKGWPWYLNWSPDSKKIMFTDQTSTLSYVDIEDKKVMKVDKSDVDDIDYFSWSPDSKWIAYVKVADNYFGSIYLYSLEDREIHQITSDFYDDYNPTFDPEGKYLYFFSNRSWYPQLHHFEHNFNYVLSSDICVATLQAETPSPFEPESDEEEVKEEDKDKGEEKEEKEKEKGEKEKDEKEEKAEEEKKITIDLEGIETRIVTVPIKPGNYFGLSATEEKIFYVTVPEMPVMEGPPDLSGVAIMTYDMKKREEKDVIRGINGYDLSADGKKILYVARNILGIIDAVPGKKVGDGKIATEKMEAKVDPAAEWKQMFTEAWRLERDFFYDPDMHGIDWNMMKKRYGELLPYIGHRDDLNYIIGELIAELVAGHTYVGGGDYPQYPRVGVGLLGCDFEIDERSRKYRITKIYPGKNWDKHYRAPLTQPGIEVKEGDYLLKINGIELTYPMNPYELLENTAEKQTFIEVSADPEGNEVREYTVEPIGNESWVRYADWVETNRKKVAEATDGRVGYIHVPNTSIVGLNEFASAFYPQVYKEGIIVDVRYNSGGMIPDLFIERLSRSVMSLWARREVKSFRTPITAPVGHLVCVINAYAGSGGDAFPYYFRVKGLGPLIGMRTWGGLIGISRGIRLMDGGRVTMPTFAFYTLEGEWDVENRGVSPDIEVDNRPDLVVKGGDPQLEKAIEVIMRKIEEEPPKLPAKPKYPDKR